MERAGEDGKGEWDGASLSGSRPARRPNKASAEEREPDSVNLEAVSHTRSPAREWSMESVVNFNSPQSTHLAQRARCCFRGPAADLAAPS